MTIVVFARLHTWQLKHRIISVIREEALFLADHADIVSKTGTSLLYACMVSYLRLTSPWKKGK